MRTWTIVVVLFATAAAASAQVAEIGAFGGIHRLRGNDLGTLDGVNVALEDGWLMGFRLTLNNYRFFGHEFGYSYNRTSMRFDTTPPQKSGTAFHRGLYNFLIYGRPEGASVRPFVTGGGHFGNYAWPGSSAVSGGGSMKFGFNYGGGIKVRITPMFGIRVDVRNYRNGKPFGKFLADQSGSIRQLEMSAGFSLLL